MKRLTLHRIASSLYRFIASIAQLWFLGQSDGSPLRSEGFHDGHAGGQTVLMSHPLLLWLLGEYWFCISRFVYDRNRPLAPILWQSRCSLMYDVFWLAKMVMVVLVQWYSRIEIPGIQSRIRIESLSFEQWTMKKWKAKEQKSNKRTNENWITNKINKQQ